SMSEEEKLTARERRKMLREFSELGRDAVRYNLQVGGYGVAQRRDLAFEWLREQEAKADKNRRWTLYAAVIAAAAPLIEEALICLKIRCKPQPRFGEVGP